MKTAELMKKSFWGMVILMLLSFLSACQEDAVVQAPEDVTTDRQALERMVEEDSALTSFEPNFDDSEYETLGKIEEEIYPLRVWKKMRLVNKNLTIDFQDTLAYGHLTLSFEGKLVIAASYDSNSVEPDTLIEKPCNEVITRNIIFKKIGNSPQPLRNWIIAAISLPEGGTVIQPRSIDILKLTAYFENNDSLVIESPNDFYLRRGWGAWRNIPRLQISQSVTLKLEVYSDFEEEDYVSLTYGANKWIRHRVRKLFELESSVQSGNGWLKVYVQTYTAHNFPGFYHAVINAMPKQVIHDDVSPVEFECWGIPYLVRL